LQEEELLLAPSEVKEEFEEWVFMASAIRAGLLKKG